MKTIARRVGRYEIKRVIGRGGMATVYLARQPDLDREVALKELALFEGADPRLARRFLREVGSPSPACYGARRSRRASATSSSS